MPEAQTWIIIIRFKKPYDVPRRPFNPLFTPKMRGDGGTEISGIESILLDRPMIILPDGHAEKIEIFPITDTTIVHSSNFKRVLH